MAAKRTLSSKFLLRFLPAFRLTYPNANRINGPRCCLLYQSTKRNAETRAPGSSGIRLSESCVKQLHKIGASDRCLRVLVEGGGCSGFQYKFELDDQVREDDKIFERNGVRIIVDEMSLDILQGSLIDYSEELIRSSFRVVDNPKAEMGCSCGVSFSIKPE